MDQSLPKVLVVSINAWRENSGINTLMNIFSTWEPACLAQVYTRADRPATTVASRFFRISESRVLRSVYRRGTKTGAEVQPELPAAPTAAPDAEADREHARYRKSGRSGWLRLAREMVWRLGRWKTPELDAFVADVDPDVLFFPIYPTVYMGRLQLYIRKRTQKPVVCYISDDNYSYRAVSGLAERIHRFFLRRVVKKLMTSAEQVLVIAPKQKEEYDRLFGIDCAIITKGIDYTGRTYTPLVPHTPIRMVYTGKLIIGRGHTLSQLAAALAAINTDPAAPRITLDIYTTDTLTEKQMAALSRNGCAVRGALSLEESRRVQAEADVLVFVEGLERRYRNAARLSFSTKLTDYFAAGKCILAIGGADIAPIDYLVREDAGLVASSVAEMRAVLSRLAEDPTLVDAYGRKAFECGLRNHEAAAVSARFRACMLEAADPS